MDELSLTSVVLVIGGAEISKNLQLKNSTWNPVEGVTAKTARSVSGSFRGCSHNQKPKTRGCNIS
jgi:hypothetical protein